MDRQKLNEIEKINIRDLVKSARSHAKLTQKEVADALGVDRSTYTYCENGRTKLDIIFLLKVCSVCNISLEEVLKLNPNVSKTNIISSNVPDYLFNSESDISEFEQKIIAHVRQLNDRDKEIIFDMITRLVQNK